MSSKAKFIFNSHLNLQYLSDIRYLFLADLSDVGIVVQTVWRILVILHTKYILGSTISFLRWKYAQFHRSFPTLHLFVCTVGFIQWTRIALSLPYHQDFLNCYFEGNLLFCFFSSFHWGCLIKFPAFDKNKQAKWIWFGYLTYFLVLLSF